MSAIDEIQTVRAAAARVGCRVLEMGVGPDGHARARIRCATGWDAARFLLALACIDARGGWARDTAARMRAMTSSYGRPNDWAFVAYAHATVQSRIKFRPERGEIFAGPQFTWNVGVGDCDDHARLLYAILAAGGVPVRLAFLYREWAEGPAHVVVQAFYDGAWHWCETTVRAELGEEPYAAAIRLGVVKSRADIAKQVTTMSESDLPPVPPGFDARTTPAQLARDVKALHELGYLCDASGITVADDPRFRGAVQSYQRDRHLKDDGLIGPKTRADIGSLVPWYAQTMGEVTARTSYLSDAFFVAVVEMARDFQARGANVTGEDFFLQWLSESGANPARKGNPPFDQEFGGLNMSDHNARAIGGFTGTLDEWVALPDVQQLAFVRRFYERTIDAPNVLGGSYAGLVNGGALYLMNFLPVYTKHASDPTAVLASADGRQVENDPRSAGWYRDNRGLDVDGKGWIDVADMTKALERAKRQSGAKWTEIQERLRAAEGSDSSGLGASSSVAGLVFLGLAAAGLIYAMRT